MQQKATASLNEQATEVLVARNLAEKGSTRWTGLAGSSDGQGHRPDWFRLSWFCLLLDPEAGFSRAPHKAPA
jgi:hypothetical protein